MLKTDLKLSSRDTPDDAAVWLKTPRREPCTTEDPENRLIKRS